MVIFYNLNVNIVMKKNIIVLCFGRSGSTNFLDAFVENEKLGYINAAEIFCRGKQIVDIIETQKKNFVFLDANFSEDYGTFEQTYNKFASYNNKNKPVIMKMWIGWHLHYWNEKFYKYFYNNSHVIWLFRKDIIAQGISGRLTDPRYRSLEHVDKVKMNPFVLDFNYEKDINWKIEQLENFVENLTPVDNLIISEDIFNKDAAIETLRSMYGINFYKRPQNNPDYLKRQLIINYDDIQAEMIKLGYVSRMNVAINKLRWHARSKEIIKNVVGKL
jgi:hypothetical protein